MIQHDAAVVNLADPRIKAGVLLTATGRGDDAVIPFVAEHTRRRFRDIYEVAARLREAIFR